MATNLFTRNRTAVIIAGLFATALIGWLDYLTGYRIDFSLLYFLPVAYVAWFGTLGPAFGVSFFALITWYAADTLSGHISESTMALVWNSSMRAGSLLVVTYVVHRLRVNLDRARTLNSMLETSLDQVSQLKGLLPICAWCHDVRNDEGYWESVDSFLQSHSHLEFSHGICPNCAAKYFPGSKIPPHDLLD
ncbi:MAG: hypothetical protein OEM41_10810, partial [Ignavibacteria bacterium]|nr:hypothetical protein [Ignavibacteria bacterium]